MSSSDSIGRMLGAYSLPRLLGRGSFGDVYLGEHVRLNRQVAIKVLHMALTTENIRIFLDEVRLISSLNHAHIVPIYDFGMEGDMVYIVMDYAPGGSLRQRHPKGSRVPLQQVVTYVKPVASALSYAHKSRLIHRDIRPENMLLGGHNEVLLGDFEIALISSSSTSRSTETAAGTVSYMAPEQILGKPQIASDQYALGVVVYEWLCGTLPFLGSFAEVEQQHLFAPPPSFQEQGVEIPPSVEAVVRKALAKKPEERFADVQDFALALELAGMRLEENQPLLSDNQRERFALSVLTKSSLLLKVYSSLYSALGKFLSILGFNNEALMAYEHAIFLGAHHPLLYIRKGEALFHLKRYKEALTALDEAVRLAPESSKAYRVRGKTFEQLAQQSYDEFKQRAQQSYEKAKELGIE